MNLLEKYNRPGPRYTSYPAYPHWDSPPSHDEWLEELHGMNDLRADLYVHIPYCQSLCTYCGCTRTISRDLKKGLDYTSLLLDEWMIYKDEFPHLKIDSLHFGGGTPTFLKAEYLRALLENFSPYFSESFSGAAEIDPRVTSQDQIEVLHQYGVDRLSLGIQDFDPKVQKICNRIQPASMVEGFLKMIRGQGVQNINFDLIYGLPEQTIDSITQTMDHVRRMRPETIALYGYAHVPWRSKAQKSLEKYHIPSGPEKRALYEKSKDLLLESGYLEIGLDHFALEENGLYQSFKKGELKRTFMGYSTQKAPVTLGLGVSAISSTKKTYIQNDKEVLGYSEKLFKGEVPLFNGHKLSMRDQVSARIIQSIMCQNRADFATLMIYLNDEEKSNLFYELEELERDGIVKLTSLSLEVPEAGRAFLRNICMPFDHRLTKEENRFSKTV